MAKVDGDDVELTDGDAAMIKGMLIRGDKQHHIAAWFGVDSRAVSHVSTGKTHVNVKALEPRLLPPPGSFRPDPVFVGFYRMMVEVNELWEKEKLKAAKALLEAALRQPTARTDRSSIDEAADDMMRNEYGILNI